VNLAFGGSVDNLAPPLRLELPVKVLPIVRRPRRYNVLRGGRGSAKSRTVARVLATAALSPRLIGGREVPFRCLCTREIQKSMKDSVHRLIADEIRRLGLADLFEILDTEIRGPNGALFLFAGLQGHTVESMKSYEGLTDVWVEEASAVCDRSWEILIPTLRGKGARFYITFNPDLEADPVWQRFVVSPPKSNRIHSIELNYEDNPWFEDTELPEESEQLKRQNPAAWAHVYGGQLRSQNGIIFKREWARWYDPDLPGELPVGMRFYLASDYAATPEGGDYTVHTVFGVDHRDRIYVVDCWYDQADPHNWTDSKGEDRRGWIDAGLDLVEKWRPLYWFDESGPITRSVDGAIKVAMMQRSAAGRPAYVTRVTLPSVGSKANRAIGLNTRKPTVADQARALGFAGRMSAGAVYFPKPGPGREWVLWLTNQLWAFHGLGDQLDDGTDTCSLFARGLEQVPKGAEPPKKPEDAPEPFTEAWFAERDRLRGEGQRDDAAYYEGTG
jgi:hypothetical protein